MAEEGYKFQLSLKDGDRMLNVRADDAEEFEQNISDAEEIDALGGFFDKPTKKSSTKRSSSRRSSKDEDEDEDEDEDDDDEEPDEDEPTPAQLKFAKQLRIRGADKMTKRELSDAIDRKKSRR